MVAPSPMHAAPTAEEIALRLERAGRKVAADAICDISRPEPIAPRLAASLCGADRLVVGESALALDPLRGDGSGFALRGALLAQAVLAAIEDGHGIAQYLAHYEKRLRSTFVGHLRGCSAHYGAARHSAIWARRHRGDGSRGGGSGCRRGTLRVQARGFFSRSDGDRSRRAARTSHEAAPGCAACVVAHRIRNERPHHLRLSHHARSPVALRAGDQGSAGDETGIRAGPFPIAEPRACDGASAGGPACGAAGTDRRGAAGSAAADRAARTAALTRAIAGRADAGHRAESSRRARGAEQRR